MRRHVPRIVLFLLAVLLAVQAPVRTQSIGGHAIVWVSAVSVRNDGTRAGYARSDHEFTPGKRSSSYVWIGAADDGSWCERGASESPAASLETLVREHVQVWKLMVTPVKTDDDSFIFWLEWARYANGNAARPVESGRRQLAINEDQTVVLDLLRAPDAGSCPYESVVLETGILMREDATVADKVLQYDLWLVHADPAGGKQTEHVMMRGQHGIDVPFVFGALRAPVPTLTAGQLAYDVATRVTGTMRGRLRADGLIDVAFDVSRADRLERRDNVQDVSRGGDGEGQKTLHLTPGQAVEIELPAPNGFHGQRATAQAIPSSPAERSGGAANPSMFPSEPLSVVDGRLVLSFKPYFVGHRFTVLLQVRPIA